MPPKLQIIQNHLIINIQLLLLLFFVSNSIAISIINETAAESIPLSNKFPSNPKFVAQIDQSEKIIKMHQKNKKTNYNETYAHMMMGLSGAAYAHSPNACMQRYKK